MSPIEMEKDSLESEGFKESKPINLMNVLYVVPAYGRDYRTKDQVVAAWDAGKDFRINTLSHPDNGRYVNIRDAKEFGVTHIQVTFNKGKQIHLISIDPNS